MASARRFEFGWLEVFGLILIFAGGSAVVFFLGIFVGKGLQESRLAREERLVRLPVDAGGVARPAEASRDNELRLSDELARGGPAATPAVNLAVRRSTETAPTSEPRLVGVPPTVAPVTAAATPVPAVEAVEEITRAAPVPSPAGRIGERAEDVASSGGGRSWSVQVNATRDDATASSLVRRLQERGYNAYVVKVGLQGDTWYRVRVGRFPTMEAATAVVVRLKNEERYSRAFLVND
jgi:cell division septation protein DedD